ncbi:hypothetical protein P879_07819 [Paragonimus westermani]|uniref:Uncharacterized protein n=1 Tax=Paragonimus westermani TaxID=34504 RepID=A0A8T0DS02_9TREM|nr:hypothetical protein P879_07819 [Paragonimus westermani]
MELARLRSIHQQLSSVVDKTNPSCRIEFTLHACSVPKTLQLSISNEDAISSLAPNLDHYLRNLSASSLSIGLRLCILPFSTSDIHLETEFLFLYDQVKTPDPTSNDAASWPKSKLVDLTHKYRLMRTEQNCLLDRVQVHSILPPDKGSGVIILRTIDHIARMSQTPADCLEFRLDANQKDFIISV